MKKQSKASIKVIKTPKKEKKDDAPEQGIVKTQEDVSRCFGVTARCVRKWIDQGMPGKAGRYVISQIQEWKQLREGKKDSKKEKDPSSDWEDRYRRAKALREERRNELESGEVVLKSEVEAGLIQISVAIRRALLTLPRIFAPVLQGKEPREIEAISRKKVEEIIDMFAKDKIFSKTEDKNAGNDRKAKHLDRKRK